MSAIWSRVNTLLLVLVLMGLIAVIGELGTRAWGGPLDPPGAPGPTQPQVEPRSPIPPVGWDGTFPITISQSGSYFLTQNLTNPGTGNGIIIQPGDVTLDLNGFSLRGSGRGTGILVTAQQAPHIQIKNGAVGSWNNAVDMTTAVGAKVESLDVSDNTGTGLALGPGAFAHGVIAQRDNAGITVNDPTHTFDGGLIDGCVATQNGWGVWLYANNVTVTHCNLDSNGVVGLGTGNNTFFDTITDNTMQGVATGVSLTTGTSGNTVARNVFAANSIQPVRDDGSGNRVAPITTIATANGWNNIGQ